MANTPKPSLLSKLRPTLRDAIVFAIAALVVVPIALWLHVHAHTSEIPDKIGPFMSGIGHILSGVGTAAVAVATVIGAKFARDTYVKWEERHLREKQFGAGAEALGSALEICDLLESIADKELPTPPPEKDIDKIEHWRSKLLSNAPGRFRAAQRSIEIYFPDPVVAIFVEIAKELDDLSKTLDAARRRADSFGGRLPDHSKKMIDFLDLSLVIPLFRDSLKATLRPFILFERAAPDPQGASEEKPESEES